MPKRNGLQQNNSITIGLVKDEATYLNFEIWWYVQLFPYGKGTICMTKNYNMCRWNGTVYTDIAGEYKLCCTKSLILI